eukprot:SAG31_NODE_35225_length_325_cov_0.685841_1_plen_47_part_01
MLCCDMETSIAAEHVEIAAANSDCHDAWCAEDFQDAQDSQGAYCAVD